MSKQPMFKKANISFKDSRNNYSTTVNGKLSDEEIIKYFKYQLLNLGNVRDNVQICIDCTVSPSEV